MAEELPKLFSDEEFGALHKQREEDGRSAHDIRGEAQVRVKPQAADGLPESTIEQKFPHIAKKLTLLWRSEAFATYFSRLQVSDRPGRRGLPAEVMEDLMMLNEINERLIRISRLGPEAASPPAWDELDEHSKLD